MSIQVGKVYKIVNKINNMVYIGCTINSLDQRFHEHLYRCFKTDYKSKLYNSIKKYGGENFEISLLEECSLDVLYETEKKYISEYNSYEQGMNSTFGGEGCLGYQHSSEIKEKISKSLKNGKSHKGKTYEELYGSNAEEEKIKRRNSVKNKWDNMNEIERTARIQKLLSSTQYKNKFSKNLIKEVKDKLRIGIKIGEVQKMYPELSKSYLYSLNKNKRCVDI